MHPVSISYNDLKKDPKSLSEAIQQAFGPQGLGVIIVKDLPSSYPEKRERLLRYSNAFASLPESTREKYARPEVYYLFGWSHGKEIMNGVPDVNKGSYYANPLVDHPDVSDELRASHPMYYADNVWPEKGEESLEGFEEAFKDLGCTIFDVGILVAQACESFVSAQVHSHSSSNSIVDIIRTSQCNKARLLHYFAPEAASSASLVEPDGSGKQQKEVVVDDACGLHLDHSLLTGLCSAMYLRHDQSPNEGPPATIATSSGTQPTITTPPDPTAGLWICPRGTDTKPVKVSIPSDCLAFQTGEALSVLTGGRLAATPHFVRAGEAVGGDKITRETFAFFLQPDVERPIGQDGETFGAFSQRILKEHHGEQV